MNAIKISVFVRNAVRQALNFVFPPLCPYCGERLERAHSVCPKCFGRIRFIGEPRCDWCGRPFDFKVWGTTLCGKCLTARYAYDKARAAFVYDDFSRAPILQLKHARKTELAGMLTQFLYVAGQELFPETDAIVCVPIHRYRLMKRTFNQAGILARLLAKKIDKPFLAGALKRVRPTKSQGHLSPTNRKRNVANAFRVSKNVHVKGRSILLIDDVLTTGATVNECAKALKRAGAKSVFVLTVAMVVK